ncbi:MAG: ribonuclease R [Helicobacteraceae bacterium]|jgi:ribonuclease R|nr:ribonuclease R [Helicobacteraceae bacterium]
MRDFLLKLVSGVPLAALNKSELRDLQILVKRKIISERSFLRLPDNLIVGVFQQPKITSKGKSAGGFLTPLGGFQANSRGKNLAGSRMRDLLVLPADALGAAHHDLVIAEFLGNRRGRAAAKIIFIAEESAEKLICYIEFNAKRAVVFDINTAQEIDVNVKQKNLREFESGAVLAIDRRSGEITEVLGNINDPKVDEFIVLSKYNRSDIFSAEQIMEAKSFSPVVDRNMFANRADLTNLPFITIDPKDAKDFDDAIYYDFERRVLYVAIADVSSYIFDFSEIDKEAKKRGFSVYLPHKSVPMLPRELSENLCSLQPNAERLTFTFKIELDENLNVKKYELFESIIKSVHRFHYDRVDEVLSDPKVANNEEKTILNWLSPLRDLITALRSKRLKKGFSFSNPEIKLVLDENLRLKETIKAVETISHQLIEECMLLANCAAAEYFQLGIFRTHEKPDDRSIEELLVNLAEIGINVKKQKTFHETIEKIQIEAERFNIKEQVDRLLIRSLKRAQYTYDNVGHFGLGFQKYTHFTSPIRRYSDLMLHRLLKAILTNNEKQKNYILQTLQRLCPIISQLEIEAAQIEWQYADRAYARWAKDHIGITLQGEVIEEADKTKTAVIIIDDPLIQGMRVYLPLDRKNAQTIHKFKTMKVTIADAHLATARITAKLA